MAPEEYKKLSSDQQKKLDGLIDQLSRGDNVNKDLFKSIVELFATGKATDASLKKLNKLEMFRDNYISQELYNNIGNQTAVLRLGIHFNKEPTSAVVLSDKKGVTDRSLEFYTSVLLDKIVNKTAKKADFELFVANYSQCAASEDPKIQSNVQKIKTMYDRVITEKDKDGERYLKKVKATGRLAGLINLFGGRKKPKNVVAAMLKAQNNNTVAKPQTQSGLRQGVVTAASRSVTGPGPQSVGNEAGVVIPDIPGSAQAAVAFAKQGTMSVASALVRYAKGETDELPSSITKQEIIAFGADLHRLNHEGFIPERVAVFLPGYDKLRNTDIYTHFVFDDQQEDEDKVCYSKFYNFAQMRTINILVAQAQFNTTIEKLLQMQQGKASIANIDGVIKGLVRLFKTQDKSMNRTGPWDKKMQEVFGAGSVFAQKKHKDKLHRLAIPEQQSMRKVVIYSTDDTKKYLKSMALSNILARYIQGDDFNMPQFSKDQVNDVNYDYLLSLINKVPWDPGKIRRFNLLFPGLTPSNNSEEGTMIAQNGELVKADKLLNIMKESFLKVGPTIPMAAPRASQVVSKLQVAAKKPSNQGDAVVLLVDDKTANIEAHIRKYGKGTGIEVTSKTGMTLDNIQEISDMQQKIHANGDTCVTLFDMDKTTILRHLGNDLVLLGNLIRSGPDEGYQAAFEGYRALYAEAKKTFGTSENLGYEGKAVTPDQVEFIIDNYKDLVNMVSAAKGKPTKDYQSKDNLNLLFGDEGRQKAVLDLYINSAKNGVAAVASHGSDPEVIKGFLLKLADKYKMGNEMSPLFKQGKLLCDHDTVNWQGRRKQGEPKDSANKYAQATNVLKKARRKNLLTGTVKTDFALRRTSQGRAHH